MKEDIDKLFEDLNYEEVPINNVLIVDFTRLYDGKTLKEKVEAKFKVNITRKVHVMEEEKTN